MNIAMKDVSANVKEKEPRVYKLTTGQGQLEKLAGVILTGTIPNYGEILIKRDEIPVARLIVINATNFTQSLSSILDELRDEYREQDERMTLDFKTLEESVLVGDLDTYIIEGDKTSFIKGHLCVANDGVNRVSGVFNVAVYSEGGELFRVDPVDYLIPYRDALIIHPREQNEVPSVMLSRHPLSPRIPKDDDLVIRRATQEDIKRMTVYSAVHFLFRQGVSAPLRTYRLDKSVPLYFRVQFLGDEVTVVYPKKT